MEKIPGNDLEQKENYGRDVTIIVDLIRHGEKEGPIGPLTEKGRQEAEIFGEKLREEFPDSAGIKAYHSRVPRAQ